MKIKFSPLGAGYGYQWHVVTGEGVVVVGTVHKSLGRWEATVTHKDGEALFTRHGGRFGGFHANRSKACETAVRRAFESEADAWVRLMNA